LCSKNKGINSYLYSLAGVGPTCGGYYLYTSLCFGYLDWIKLDITILSTIVLLSVFFTGLVFLVCQSEFCLGLLIKSCRLVNYCTIRAIVKIKMLRKVVFGTFQPIVNRSVR